MWAGRTWVGGIWVGVGWEAAWRQAAVGRCCMPTHASRSPTRVRRVTDGTAELAAGAGGGEGGPEARVVRCASARCGGHFARQRPAARNGGACCCMRRAAGWRAAACCWVASDRMPRAAVASDLHAACCWVACCCVLLVGVLLHAAGVLLRPDGVLTRPVCCPAPRATTSAAICPPPPQTYSQVTRLELTARCEAWSAARVGTETALAEAEAELQAIAGHAAAAQATELRALQVRGAFHSHAFD